MVGEHDLVGRPLNTIAQQSAAGAELVALGFAPVQIEAL